MTAREIFEKIVYRAKMLNWLHGDKQAYERALKAGHIPDKLLPGRIVMQLQPEEQLVLSDLKSEDTQDRQD